MHKIYWILKALSLMWSARASFHSKRLLPTCIEVQSAYTLGLINFCVLCFFVCNLIHNKVCTTFPKSTYQIQRSRSCMKINRGFQGMGVYVHKIEPCVQDTGRHSVSVACELGRRKESWTSSEDSFQKSHGSSARGFVGFGFALWVTRGYWRILSKRFICMNHKDCVFSWQNSLWESQTSCQLLPGPLQITIVSGSSPWTSLTDDVSEPVPGV